MSNYQFFASKTAIKEYDNLRIKKITKDNSTCLSMRFPVDELHAMRIIKEEDLSLTAPYTDKRYCNYIEWHYNDENAKIIIDFIKEHLLTSYTIELWNTWLGDASPALKHKIPLSNLNISDIQSIWGKNSFNKNECLVVYKEY